MFCEPIQNKLSDKKEKGGLVDDVTQSIFIVESCQQWIFISINQNKIKWVF